MSNEDQNKPRKRRKYKRRKTADVLQVHRIPDGKNEVHLRVSGSPAALVEFLEELGGRFA